MNNTYKEGSKLQEVEMTDGALRLLSYKGFSHEDIQCIIRLTEDLRYDYIVERSDNMSKLPMLLTDNKIIVPNAVNLDNFNFVNCQTLAMRLSFDIQAYIHIPKNILVTYKEISSPGFNSHWIVLIENYDGEKVSEPVVIDPSLRKMYVTNYEEISLSNLRYRSDSIRFDPSFEIPVFDLYLKHYKSLRNKSCPVIGVTSDFKNACGIGFIRNFRGLNPMVNLTKIGGDTGIFRCIYEPSSSRYYLMGDHELFDDDSKREAMQVAYNLSQSNIKKIKSSSFQSKEVFVEL